MPIANDHMKTLISRNARSALGISLFIVLVLVAGVAVYAKQYFQKAHSSGTSPDITIPGRNASSSQAQDSEALLPRIAKRSEVPIRLEGISVDEMVAKVPSGTFHHDPDEYKSLYGYYGPFYNTINLDNRVVVLDQTLYTWPATTWKASGMIRNQTRQPVHIKSVNATLRGRHGEVLDTVIASVPVSNLRAGEPGPFLIESALSRSAISSIEWDVAFEVSQDKPRPFVFDIVDDRGSREGILYDLFVTIRNDDANAIRRVRVVAAWLDDRDKVFYVDSPMVRPTDDPKTWSRWADLAPGSSGDIIYRTEDPSLVSRLIKARRVLWGIAE